jgi:hypothetical protein
VATAKRLLGELPATNWFKRNAEIGDHLLGDAGIADLLLPARDRAYSIADFARLLASGGLRIASMVAPIRYDPALYLTDPELRRRIDRLSPLERAGFAELLAGNMTKHVGYAVKAANPARTVATPDSPTAVPVLREPDDPTVAAVRGAPPGQAVRLVAHIDGYAARLGLPARAPAMLTRIDGKAGIGGIFAQLGGGDWAAFKREFDALYAVLNGLGKLFLRRPRA